MLGTNYWSSENVKVVAYELARLRVERDGASRSSLLAQAPAESLPSLICSGQDWVSHWLPYWASRLRMQPALHRKLWEFAYIAQVLSAAGALRPGSRGISFGCGKEPLASLFVASGCDVLATDLGASDPRAMTWSIGEQHADSMASIWVPELCSKADADARLRFRAVDMNAVPSDLEGEFDFCWSSCALEHLGSIENGLAFIEASARCLRPGGLAVHTTEFNIDLGPTLADGPTVLFQLPHLHDLAARLGRNGVQMRPISVRPDEPFLDEYVDVPPFPDPSSVGSTLSVLHLRLQLASYRTTSVGLVAERVGAAGIAPGN